MNTTPADITAITTCHVGALAVSYGCNGTEIEQYVLYRTAHTTADIDRDWTNARTAGAQAVTALAEQQPVEKVLPFNERSTLTLGEHRQALLRRKMLTPLVTAQRRAALHQAEQEVWDEAGAELIRLRYGRIPTHAGDIPDGIPQVIHRHGCRCASGDHHSDSSPSTHVTPAMTDVCVDSTHPTAVLCGTTRFITTHRTPETITRALDAVREAVGVEAERQQRLRANLAARAATPVVELEAMTFHTLAAWQQQYPIENDWPKPAVDLDAARHSWHNRLMQWDTHAAAALEDIALHAASQQQLWAVGTPIEND